MMVDNVGAMVAEHFRANQRIISELLAYPETQTFELTFQRYIRYIHIEKAISLSRDIDIRLLPIVEAFSI